MGKKSRLKRERRLRKAKEACDLAQMRSDKDFESQISELEKLFAQYNAEDVYISLCISDLWLPNISSIVKHYFSIGIFLSMDSSRFNHELKIDSYKTFENFIGQVYSLLPEFIMLEDYVPETDWGEVKVLLNSNYYRIFYGGSVERIPDFIEAFRLLHSSVTIPKAGTSNSAPLDDLSIALQLQHNIVSTIDNPFIGADLKISPGHIEIPSASFWKQCRISLLMAMPTIPENIQLSSDLMLVQGSFSMPKTMSEFGNGMFSGAFMPAILAKVGESLLPISPRNSAEKVMEYWDDSASININTVIDNMTVFIEQRFIGHQLIVGPCSLITKKKQIPLHFAAIILSKNKVYLVGVLHTELLKHLSSIESDITNVLSGAAGEWVFMHDKLRHAYQLSERYALEDIELIIVLPHVSLTPQVLPLPSNTKARVLGLTDFITITDSLENNLEFEKFWSFVDEQTGVCGPMTGISDLFGSFRDTYGVLVDGAISPTMIALDPHWGSNWRYKVLAEFWKKAPEILPNDSCTAWKIDAPESNGIQQLISKGPIVAAWHSKVGDCAIYFLFEFDKQELDETNGRILELFMHCTADALAQQKSTLEKESLFKYKRIVTFCRGDPENLIKEDDDYSQKKLEGNLFSKIRVVSQETDNELTLTIDVNLSFVQQELTKPIDASFEEKSLREWLECLYKLLGLKLDKNILLQVSKMRTRQARFAISIEDKLIDLPDYASPLVPSNSHYKLARRKMAQLFMATGIEPGRYELAEAKAIIDKVKNSGREIIHELIGMINRKSLIIFCIEQYDALITAFLHASTNINFSLTHEVSYDRSERLAKLHDDFIQNARNYRYLLECVVSSTSTAELPSSEEKVVELVALIDWLFVLYGASDVLHNDIDVGGVELDQFFIPQVFYSQHKDAKERKFGEESASYKLGLGLDSNDEVNLLQEDFQNFEVLDKAFLLDIGFSFTHFVSSLHLLTRWQASRGEKECFFSYKADSQTIIDVLIANLDELPFEDANKIVEFLTLEPNSVRLLIGKNTVEGDVPVWEHNKRGSRYAIRPLIPIDGVLHWGAGAAERSLRVWVGSISNGYLPADFQWPNVKAVIRNIKLGIVFWSSPTGHFF